MKGMDTGVRKDVTLLDRDYLGIMWGLYSGSIGIIWGFCGDYMGVIWGL